MRTTTFIAAGLALAAFGCDKPDTGSTAPTPNSASNMAPNEQPVTVTNTTVAKAPPPADPLAAASNKDVVVQYSDMVRLPPTPGNIVTGLTTVVRDSPRGKQVEVVETGMTATVIGKRNDYYLVMYPDPKDSSKQLAGWVYKDAIDASSWPAVASATKTAEATPQAPANAKSPSPAKLTCASGQTQLRSNGDFCANTCKKDDDCTKSPGGLCDGVAYDVKKDGSMASTLNHYCILTSANVDRAAAEGHTTTQAPGQAPKAPH